MPAPLPVDLDGLTCSLPVAAARWGNLRVGDVTEVRAERWTIDQLDFLDFR
jgi:hypothetical protein